MDVGQAAPMLEKRATLRKEPPGIDRDEGGWFILSIPERQVYYRRSQALVRSQVRPIRQHIGDGDPFPPRISHFSHLLQSQLDKIVRESKRAKNVPCYKRPIFQ